MQQFDPCVVCQLPDQHTSAGDDYQSIRFRCARCGTYDWVGGSAPQAGRAKRQVLMSGFIQAQNRAGILPYFTADLVAQVERMRMPSLRERSDQLLQSIVDTVGYNRVLFGVFIDLKIQAETFSKDAEALTPLVDILNAEGFIIRRNDGVELTPKGYLEIDGRSARTATSAQGFVAMSFDKTMDLGSRLIKSTKR